MKLFTLSIHSNDNVHICFNGRLISWVNIQPWLHVAIAARIRVTYMEMGIGIRLGNVWYRRTS